MNNLHASPMVRAGYRLAREFGWTPQQLQELTMAQVGIYLQMLEDERQVTGE